MAARKLLFAPKFNATIARATFGRFVRRLR